MDPSSGGKGWFRRHGIRLAIVAVVALSGFGTGLNWGLPQATSPETIQPWALDTIAPIAPLNEAYYGFTRSGNEYVIYPLFHYMVLSGAYAPYVGYQYLAGKFDNPRSEFPYGLADVAKFAQDLTLIARLVSLAMALTIVLLTYRITLQLVGNDAAFWAALSASLIAPLTYYAKTSNLDVPYTFWVCLAVWRYLAILEHQRLRDYALLGAFAALAVATKDQAYGFFVLIPLALAWARASASPVTVRRFATALFSKPMLIGAVATVFTYGVANNVFFGGLDGLLRHLSWGGDVFDFRQEAADSFYGVGAQLRLTGRTGLILLQMLGPVTLALGAYGVFLAWRERRWKMLSLILFGVSYHLTVIVVFNIVFSRYLLVSTILLMPFFGLALERLRASRDGLLLPAVLASAAILPQMLLVANLNLTLVADSRVAMSEWIRSNVPIGATIESQIRQRMLPHISPDYDVRIAGNSGDAITMAAVESELTSEALASRNPDYILFLEELGVTGDPMGWDTPELASYYDKMRAGQLGYTEVARFETPSYIPWQQIPGTRPVSVLFARSERSLTRTN